VQIAESLEIAGVRMRKNIWLLVMALFLNVDAAWSRPAPAAHKTPVSAAANKGGAGTAANNAYINRLRGKLMDNWHVLMQDGKNHVVITAVVNADGTVQDMQITSSPKNQSAEQAGNEAFAKIQPLEALPSGSGQAKLTLTFDSTSDPHGDSSSNIYTHILPIPQAKPAPGANATGEPAK
jgi:hypothetical protein